MSDHWSYFGENSDTEPNGLSQEASPLIRIKPMESLCTPPTASSSSSTVSIASIFPSTQKKRKLITADESSVKRSQKLDAGALPSQTPTTQSSSKTPQPSSSTRQASKKQTVKSASTKNTKSTRRPTAENTGMKPNALDDYFPKLVASAKQGKTITTENVSSANRDLSVNESNPVSHSAGANEVEVTNSAAIQPPRPDPYGVFSTPPKSQPNESVSTLTVTPRLVPPAKTPMQRRALQETTPPPEESTKNNDPVCRQLQFNVKLVKEKQVGKGKEKKDDVPHTDNCNCPGRGSGGNPPPPQMEPTQTRARIDAYRNWQVDGLSSELEDYNPNENEKRGKIRRNSNQENETPISIRKADEPLLENPTGVSSCPVTTSVTAKSASDHQAKIKPKAKRMLQRRSSYNDSSSGEATSAPGLTKRKSIDLGIPQPLVKVLTKEFGDSIKSCCTMDSSGEVLEFELDPKYLAFLLGRCSKFCKTNAPKLAPSTEQKIFEYFINKIESLTQATEDEAVHTRLDVIPQLLQVFQLLFEETSRPDKDNCYFLIFMDLMGVRDDDNRRRQKEDDALKLVDILVKFMEITYEEYKKAALKLSFPFIASLFQGSSMITHTLQRTPDLNFSNLIERIFYFECCPKQFDILMRVFNLAAEHYYKYQAKWRLYCRDKEILQHLWSVIEQRQHIDKRTEWSLCLIQEIRCASIGKSICQRILLEEIKEIKEKTPQITDLKLDQLFKEIAESSLVLQRVREDYDHGARTDTNCKGETNFHRACASRPAPTSRVQSRRRETNLAYLEKLLDELLNPEGAIDGDINVTDNNRNTCLHDAAQNGRLDAVKLLFSKCWDPKREPSRVNLDILAVDNAGNTPLHIALSSLKSKILNSAEDEVLKEQMDVVEVLVEMAAQAPKKHQFLFSIENERMETILDFGVPGNSASDACSAFLNSKNPLNSNFASNAMKLSPESLNKIRSNTQLQKVLAQWEHFNARL